MGIKLGQRVRVVATDYYSPELANGQEGSVGVIATVGGRAVIGVKMDNGYTHLDIECWNFFEEQLEVI
ncbi:hypothetical protein D3C80_680210 [compost metagenome]